MKDVTKREHVKNEQEWTKHSALGDTMGQRSSGGGAAVDAVREGSQINHVLPVC